ncbi:hypothetical protein B296_00002733 [Ensete ventricosum]|uniref:Uncharacterized protein n=1 Tax=Ensete ventricosum TaxID=4639 RepID=A0A427AXL9_ENSVE|nr:hypothetical protein B296_00002733 [Ensete ventricosum]
MPAIHNNKLNADASYFLYVFAGGSNFALHIDNHFLVSFTTSVQKLFERSTLVVGYSENIYTCRAKGCRTKVFNRSDAFNRPADTILRETLLSSIFEVSFDETVDCQYDLLNM